VAIPLFSASIIIARIQGLGWKDVGLRRLNWDEWPVQILIGISGIILGCIEYLILVPEPLVPTLNIYTLITGFLILLISTGLAEEILFRGIIQSNAQKVFRPSFAILITSLIFTTMHMGWMSILDYLFVFIVAIIYGALFYKTNSIVGITLNHGISNTFLFIILPFYFGMYM
jgi:membrane protease YdiL (CAAX protease family)